VWAEILLTGVSTCSASGNTAAIDYAPMGSMDEEFQTNCIGQLETAKKTSKIMKSFHCQNIRIFIFIL
jgi:hypothetical protein